MRIALSASLVLLAAVLGAVAHDAQFNGDASHRRRKTLGFGPSHPRAVFITEPVHIRQNLGSSNDPLEVAANFVSQLLAQDEMNDERSSFRLREDSYTDDNTGVTHAYFRQLINGLEVADGDINVNIKDGVVLSYGDSFYRGVVPSEFSSPAAQLELPTPLEVNCAVLEQALFQSFREDNVPLEVDGQDVLRSHKDLRDAERDIEAQQRLMNLHMDNCMQSALISALDNVDGPQSYSDLGEARDAVLRFMLAATPNQDLAADIVNHYEEHVNKISSTFEDRYIGHGHSQRFEMLHDVPDTVNPVKAHIAYVQIPDGDKTALSLVWKFEVEMQDNWYEAAVMAHRPHKIISVVDWASDASESHIAPVPKKPEAPEYATYKVFSWGVNDPECGDRSFETETQDKLASPLGWHKLPAKSAPDYSPSKYGDADLILNFTTTTGNNVYAHENWEGRGNWLENLRPDAGVSMNFTYHYDPQERNSTDSLIEAKKYINATVTQLFYTVNLIHDLYYRYGFDEKSGNFQQENFERGGKGGDAVIANAQDGSGYNNANFMTPPDGQNGRCRMYLWNTANPYRDGDLEAGIVIHEYSHGLSTRLTGGPANSGCLGWGESGGMGEGWGDFLATMIRSNSTYSDFPMGAWAANREGGIRNYPYSLNFTINPSTYKTLDKPGYWGVHAIGEVWAEMLWVVAQRFINTHGFSDTLFPPLPLEDGTVPEGDFYRPAQRDANGKKKPLVPKHGNSLIVQLVINGMKLQKCMPSFFDARDAIIQADKILTGGENFCDLWIGFAERGLGTDATIVGRTPWGGGVRTDGFKVPKECRTEEIPEPEPEPTPGEPDDDDEDWVLYY